MNSFFFQRPQQLLQQLLNQVTRFHSFLIMCFFLLPTTESPSWHLCSFLVLWILSSFQSPQQLQQQQLNQVIRLSSFLALSSFAVSGFKPRMYLTYWGVSFYRLTSSLGRGYIGPRGAKCKTWFGRFLRKSLLFTRQRHFLTWNLWIFELTSFDKHKWKIVFVWRTRAFINCR